MSIFSKPLDKIEFADIQELLDDPAQENVRLEFKREPPAKDEKFSMLKKITSFANTFGGYIVFGVEERGGVAVDIPGMDTRARYDQTLSNWCWQDVYPPLTPFVSKPIELPGNAEKVFYVIHVPQSMEAPHFINGRKGCYVRTDEISRRFDPQLAKYEEIAFLANRRERSEEEREAAIQRAHRRFMAYQDQPGASPSSSPDREYMTLCFSVIPTFPSPVKFTIDQLRQFLLDEGRRPSTRSNDAYLPTSRFQSHHEGFYLNIPEEYRFSYFEIDVHGLLFCGYQGRLSNSTNQVDGDLLIDKVLRYLIYATQFHGHLGLKALLTIRVQLSGTSGKKVQIPVPDSIYHPDGQVLRTSRLSYQSGLDDRIEFSIETSGARLQEEIQSIAKQIYETICFACGGKDVQNYAETTEKVIAAVFESLCAGPS